MEEKWEVSTKTIIGVSNLMLCNLDEIYETLPLEEIKTVYYKSGWRGDHAMTTRAFRMKNKAFRNAINIIMETPRDENKRINIKMSKNGKFQMTGCKHDDDAMEILKKVITILIRDCKQHVRIVESGEVRVYMQTVMTNIDFKMDFCIDRQKLDDVIRDEPSYHSLLETSFGYTGVNIKIPVSNDWVELPVPVLRTLDGEAWNTEFIPLKNLTSDINLSKRRYNTFLVFHSGNIIMSGMRKETMTEDYRSFLVFLQKKKHDIKEVIESYTNECLQ